MVHGWLRPLMLGVPALTALLVSAPAAAQVSLEGEWVGRYHEDFMDRVPGPDYGDYTGLPINEAARFYADSWDIGRGSVPEHQCQSYNAPHIYRGPLQFRIWNERDPHTQEIVAYQQYIGTYEQRRTIWMDGRPHPPEYAPHTWMGFSTGQWHGDILTVHTTHIKAEYLRRDGIPLSDRVTLVEHYLRHGDLLTHVMIIEDPVYLTEPMVLSEAFAVMERGNANWLYNCETVEELAKPRDWVPHYLPGRNPNLTYYSEQRGIPLEAARGGAETMYPEYRATLRELLAAARSRETR
jgi:hypothetical protein